MENFRSPARILRHGAVLLAVCAAMTPALAADVAGSDDNTAEREALAAVTRQLDLLARLADYAASTSLQERTRYHFDYARLHEDVARVRAGVQDYLVPQRAQPRDALPLAGDYTRNRLAEKKPATREVPSP